VKPRDLAELLLLSAIWGGSYLFMRVGAPEFGPVALIWGRVAVGALCLAPVLHRAGLWGVLRRRAGALAVMGLFNAAIPFVLIAWAMLSVTAGLASIVNASMPIFTALIAVLWLGERFDASRSAGLLIGLMGVGLLGAERADFRPGGSGWALLAMLSAAACYGLAANLTRRFLADVPAAVSAFATQLTSTLVLALPALWLWPQQQPSLTAWGAVLALGVLCSALAYVMYFRLIARIGASRAVTVTFLTPPFGVAWGALLLGEKPTLMMGLGAVVILFGTACATGLIRLPLLSKELAGGR
jgi:drug/metabolite transporter (DMT)-like permease